MKFKKLAALLLISMMFLISACGNTTQTSTQSNNKTIKDGGSIVFAIESDPLILNPLYVSDRSTMTINNALFSPLYVLDGDKCDYYLAESMTPSKDFMTYTLKLKDNLKWHDGQKITADDVIFTMEKILDPKESSVIRESFIFDGKPLQFKKIDDLTVEFKLPKLTMAFMGLFSQFAPIPKHVYEHETSIEKSSKNETPIGSGPFKFKECKKGESYTLERFNDYFRGKAHLDTVVYRVIADPNSAKAALLNGEISANYIDSRAIDSIKSSGNMNITLINEGMVDNIVFSFNNPILNNKDLRQAIAYALNKEDIIKASYGSIEYAPKAYSVFTPETSYYTDDVNHYDLNLTKAKELLAKSGVKNLKLKFGCLNRKNDTDTGLVVQQNLKSIGIDVELIPTESSAFYNKIYDPKNKDYDLIINGYVMGTEPDNYKQIFMDGQMCNVGRYKNKDMDNMWSSAVLEADKQKREALYKTIQQKLIDDMVVYPTSYSKSIVAINKKYGGIDEAKPASIYMFQDLSKIYIIQ